jgi:hypothetical protein
MLQAAEDFRAMMALSPYLRGLVEGVDARMARKATASEGGDQ